jgi:signal transduction histidine kinase
VNTRAIDTALPQPRLLNWDRLRGLYNGVGYVVVVSIILDVWWSIQACLPQLFGGHLRQFAHDFLIYSLMSLYAMVPGPLVIPPLVNLAPRSGAVRVGFLLLAVLPMSWWCLAVVEGVHFGWNWSSAGYALDGLLTTGIVTGVCAYHGYSREAADSLLRTRIGRTRMSSELQRAQLRLLRAQIEPHFLFNTLSVVRALARNDRKATVEMLDNLIHYFAAALPRWSSDEVSLSQEIELIEAYLSIYRARMGARLTYEISLAEDWGRIRVPSMILLTLVENSLKHGVGPTLEGGSIRISGMRGGDWLRLMVADSGRGLDLRQGYGSGLANVRQRLLMMYGPKAALSLQRAQPHGVVASIMVPAP